MYSDIFILVTRAIQGAKQVLFLSQMIMLGKMLNTGKTCSQILSVVEACPQNQLESSTKHSFHLFAKPVN